MFQDLRTRSRLFLLALLCAVALPTGSALADFPDHPVTLIVPFAPGTFLEVVARAFTPYLSQALGQPVIIINKPGADGIIGLQTVVNAAPDGYTIIFTGGAESIGPALHRTFPYDPVTALTAAGPVGTEPFVVAVSSKLGVKNFAEFADYAKKHSGKLNAAAAGNSTRLGVVLLAQQLGVDVEIVSFDGTSQAATSVGTGESDFAVQNNLSFESLEKAGRLKVMLVANETRAANLPDVPTSKEAGIPEYQLGGSAGFYAPGATPPDILAKLNAAVSKAVKMPEVVQTLAKMGIEASKGNVSPAQFNDEYHRHLVSWKDLVTKAHIQPIN